jgi:hypothetical protein
MVVLPDVIGCCRLETLGGLQTSHGRCGATFEHFMQVEQEAEKAGDQAGSFFNNIFGGAAKAFEDLKGSSTDGETPKAASPTPQKAASTGDSGLAGKRAAAVASALKNLNSAAKETAEGAKPAVKDAAKAAQSSAQRASDAASSAAKEAAQAAQSVTTPAAVRLVVLVHH